MKSHHFEFLRQRASTLVDIAALAEKYWHSDPESCAVKLRAFAEHLVEGLYQLQHFPKPYNANLNDLLQERLFRNSTPLAGNRVPPVHLRPRAPRRRP